MSLELKHVAEYLPYKVKIIDKWNNQFTLTNVEIYDNHIDLNGINIEDCKLILRPLDETYCASYDQIQKLLSEHYDVFNFIPQGDAIDINDVEEK